MNLANLVGGKKSTTKKKASTTTAAAYELTINGKKVDVTETYNNDQIFKFLFDQRATIAKDQGLDSEVAKANLDSLSKRLEELKPQTAMADLLNTATKKKQTEQPNEDNEAPYDGRTVIVELFNSNTRKDGTFNYCAITSAVLDDGTKISNERIMVHSSNGIRNSVLPKLKDGAKVQGVLNWNADKNRRQYDLLEVKVIQEAKGDDNPMAQFELWLQENTLVNTNNLQKVTMTEIGAILKGKPASEVAQILSEKFPKQVAVVDGEGPRRVLYVEEKS